MLGPTFAVNRRQEEDRQWDGGLISWGPPVDTGAWGPPSNLPCTPENNPANLDILWALTSEEGLDGG